MNIILCGKSGAFIGACCLPRDHDGKCAGKLMASIPSVNIKFPPEAGTCGVCGDFPDNLSRECSCVCHMPFIRDNYYEPAPLKDRGAELLAQYEKHCQQVWEFSRDEVRQWHLSKADIKALTWHVTRNPRGLFKDNMGYPVGAKVTYLINMVTRGQTELIAIPELPATCETCGQELPCDE